MRRARLLVVLLVASGGFAGCADAPAPIADGGDQGLQVTDSTGGIRGVVVDDAIQPVAGATVTIASTGASAETGEDGGFSFVDLEPGTFFLEVARAGYFSSQTSAVVEAGVADPPILKIQISRIPGADPYHEIHQLTGFYSCAFATIFITDSCEFLVRTAHDEYEARVGDPPFPRTLQENINTLYIPWLDDIQSVVQEMYWNDDATTLFRSSLQRTPIDNGCDCSHKYMQWHDGGGYFQHRMDRDALGPNKGGGAPAEQSWPTSDELANSEVVSRGFIPFQENPQDVQTAIDVEFQLFTSLFHWYTAPDGWTLEGRYDFPDP